MNWKLLIILVLIIFTLSACSEKTSESTFLANNGELDLTQWKNEDNNLIPLSGQWDFYWNQLFSPKDFNNETAINQTGSIYMPSNWHNYTFNGVSLDREGYATFRLDVNMNETTQALGLQVPIMYSNYNLWIDDQLLAQSGQVGTNEVTSIAQKFPQVVFFTPKDHRFTITLQISNFDNYAGGMWEPIKLGNSMDIYYSNYKKLIAQAFLLGILFLSGVYHIGLGFFRKTESYFFYFGIFCLITAFRNLLVGDVFITKLIPTIDWDILMKLEYISLYSHVPVFGLFIYRLFPKDSSKRFTILAIIVSIFYTLLTIFSDAKTYYLFLIYFQVFMILGVIYAIGVLIKALTKKRPGGLYALIGLLVLLASITFDTFGFILKFPDYNLYPIGIAFFVSCFSLVLSKRLSSSLDLSEELAADLSQLNNELEHIVEKRTKQIQKSNKKLEELNNRLNKMVLIDGLTRIPNRRHFDEYIKQQYITCAKENKPLSIIFIDIDYFKLYNDLYGHQKGDECLKKVATALNKHASAYEGALIARYGGEEFVCIIPNSDQTNTEQIAEEMNLLIEQLQIPHEKSKVSKYVTISVGLTTALPSKGIHKKDMIQQADHALYQAKLTGRNQMASYSSGI